MLKAMRVDELSRIIALFSDVHETTHVLLHVENNYD